MPSVPSVLDISEVIDAMEQIAWEVHNKLTEPYHDKCAKYRDMIRLGELGSNLLKLHEARTIMQMAVHKAVSK